MVDDIKRAASRLFHAKFFWVGALSFAFLYAMFQQGRNEETPVTAITYNKELPIYSVDSEEKVVALSFDAAWGN